MRQDALTVVSVAKQLADFFWLYQNDIVSLVQYLLTLKRYTVVRTKHFILWTTHIAKSVCGVFFQSLSFHKKSTV
jgi:hypothetical protein